jgi:uncharacterized protein (DUF302 family)
MTRQPPPTAEGIVTKASAHSVAQTVSRLRHIIEAKGLSLFAVIDHSGEAARAGLAMPDTKLVIFGSPAAGTPLMLAAPLVALDLPLKVLVWTDAADAVWVSYNSPAYLQARHHLAEELAARLQAIELIAESIVA